MEALVRGGVITTGETTPDRARAHLQWLASQGLRYSEILAATGVSWPTQKRILSGDPKYIRQSTEQRLLRFRPELRRRTFRGEVPALGTRRRLRALVAFGYPQRDLADKLGLSPTNFTRFMQDSKVSVRQETADAVKALFNELQMTPGPSNWARSRGLHMGWALPLQWDEDAFDDPAAKPDQGVQPQVLFPERYGELLTLGIPHSRMPELLGIQQESFERQLSRHSLGRTA